MFITLPVSGYIAEIRESVKFREIKAIDNFYQNKLKVSVAGKSVRNYEITGELLAEYDELVTKTFLVGLKGLDGQDLPITKDYLLDELDAKDGNFLEEEIVRICDSLKKKPKETDASLSQLSEEA